jgi:Domain of unknown function (DUF4124)
MTPNIAARRTRKSMFPLALALASGLTAWHHCSAGEIYKWVDDHNGVQYTQTPPPPGTQYSRINAPQHPAGDPDAATAELHAQVKAVDDQNEANEKAASADKQDAEVSKIRQENCVTAKNNLMLLNQGGHISYKDKDGNLVRLTEEDRATRTEEAKKHIEEFCKK